MDNACQAEPRPSQPDSLTNRRIPFSINLRLAKLLYPLYLLQNHLLGSPLPAVVEVWRPPNSTKAQMSAASLVGMTKGRLHHLGPQHSFPNALAHPRSPANVSQSQICFFSYVLTLSFSVLASPST
ncbi:uncharacterized protein YALI1_A18463g [Yarrowia lipolytica]|uniref:Uncharacterized protein n=1 Tax=Yarrowia lipolytica TaxID=4952 RepID=A0A1D8N599_YARLL|nr:hypothetical protein YALI1_A18463g [Yarrowia lipolytica]